MRRIILVLVLALSGMSWAVNEDLEHVRQSPREIAARVSPSVVLLVMQDSNGQPLTMGSGFVVRDGVIATNMHVIEGAAQGYAKLTGQKANYTIDGVVASDPIRDLVFLAVEKLKASPLTIGDSNDIAVGDAIYAVGNPQGLEGTFSAGIVSGIRKVGEDSLLQITAPISPGSSGGPVVNNNGEVIGVAVATFKEGQNLNFAIPSRYLVPLIRSIKKPVTLSEITKAKKSMKEKSILDEMVGENTSGLTATQFLWSSPDIPVGFFSFSLRNNLREPVQNVICLVIFYGDDGGVLDTVQVLLSEIILPGMAKRTKSNVDVSVQELTTREGQKSPNTKLEFRILYFEIVNTDESENEQSKQESVHSQKKTRVPFEEEAPDSSQGNYPKEEAKIKEALQTARESLAESEKRLAEAVAKIAPAGDGPDYIEATIEGEFKGWDGETIFKLDNGQIWQQATYAYTYHYAYRPKVWIIKTYGAYKMKVDGVSGMIFVKQLN